MGGAEGGRHGDRRRVGVRVDWWLGVEWLVGW